MARKQFLHELLKQDQEPFRLKTYITDRRSQLNKPSTGTALHLSKHRPPSSPANHGVALLRRHACFLSFKNLPDVGRSPLFDLPSPAKSQSPSLTSAHSAKSVGLGLFGSFLKRLKDRSRSKRRDSKPSVENAALAEENGEIEDAIRESCSCSNRRQSSDNWTENNEEKSQDFEPFTSSYGSDCSEETNSDFAFEETRFCPSPFLFHLHRNPTSPGRRTPEFYSPASSPSRRVNQVEENYKSKNIENAKGEDDEDKEQCSPVSVLETPYEDDNEHEIRDTDEDDMKCNYENVQRIKNKLMYRLQRFEKLAQLDTVELEVSNDENRDERDESDCDEQLSHSDILTQVYDKSGLLNDSTDMPPDMKRFVSDLIVEENGKIIFMENNDVLISRICQRLDSWREVESNTIDMMVGFDLKGEFGRWTNFGEDLRDVSAEIELKIYGLLVEELSDELLNIDRKH